MSPQILAFRGGACLKRVDQLVHDQKGCMYSCTQILPSLSTFWLSRGGQLSPTMPFHQAISSVEPFSWD